MDSFLTRINYSSVNEDGTSEVTALRLGKDDRCLCITGSGARPLDLLTQPVGEIISIDMNPCQNHLLELKIAAIKKLSYEEFFAFIGITLSSNRLQTYTLLRGDLSFDARQFWDRSNGSIERGVFYEGSWEKYFSILAAYLRVTRKSLVDRIFSMESLEDQWMLWEKEWNDAHWRMFLRFVSSRWCWKYILRDPGFYRYVPDEFSINRYLFECFQSAAQGIHFKKSPFAAILMVGKVLPECALPLHLQKEYYAHLQSNIDRISFITASLAMIPKEQRIGPCHAFSMSDVSSYTDDSSYEKIWEAIDAVSVYDARICERQFLVKRNIPDRFTKKYVRDPSLEVQLKQNDNSIFYTFLCASKHEK